MSPSSLECFDAGVVACNANAGGIIESDSSKAASVFELWG